MIIYRFKKPTRESLSTPDYFKSIENKMGGQELDAISMHRGIDDIDRPSIRNSTNSIIGRYVLLV